MITALAALALAITAAVWATTVVVLFTRHRQTRRARQAWQPSNSAVR